MLSTRDAQIIGKPLDRGRVHHHRSGPPLCARRKPLSCVMDRYPYLSWRTLENRVQKPSTRTRAIFASYLLGRYFLSTAQATEYCGSTTLAILITALWPRSW